MILKCALLFTVICTVHSASYHGRNIPVEVRYHDSGSNLSEKIQLSPSEIGESQLRLEKLQFEALKTNEKLSAIQQKLEDEKHKTDLLAAEKATLENSKLQAAEETGHRIGALADQKVIEANKRHSEEINKLAQLTENLHEQTQLSSEQTKQALKYIPEVQNNEASDTKPTEKLSWLNQAQNYIEKGLEDLKANFKPSNGGVVPKPEFWERLDNDVRDYFKGEMNKLSLKQQSGGSQQNFFQNLASGFQQVTNNFIQGLGGSNNNATGQEDDSSSQQQAPWQGFVGYFQGGVQNLVSTVQNFGQQQAGSGNGTVLGDSGSNQSPPFFGGIISNVQQFFQGAQNAVSGGNGTQSDTPSTGSNPPGNFFQGAINQFNQVVGNFVPSSTPASAQGDDPASSTQSGPIQQVFQQFGSIGTAFNQFIQGGNQKPQGSEDDSSTSAPSQNFIQSIGQNIGNAFQNIQNQFRPPSIPSISGNDSSNPISGIAGQIQQVAGQASGSNPLENFIPGSSGSNSSSKQPVDPPKSEESNETKEKSNETFREEPIKETPEEPKKAEILESKPILEENKIEEPFKELESKPLDEKTSEEQIKKLESKPLDEKEIKEPIKELESKPIDEKKIEVPLKELENKPVDIEIKAEEPKIAVKSTQVEVENLAVPEVQNVPAVKKVENIEEIIEEVEEKKSVESKTGEAMEAVE